MPAISPIDDLDLPLKQGAKRGFVENRQTDKISQTTCQNRREPALKSAERPERYPAQRKTSKDLPAIKPSATGTIADPTKKQPPKTEPDPANCCISQGCVVALLP
jgi:hypothetical protein